MGTDTLLCRLYQATIILLLTGCLILTGCQSRHHASKKGNSAGKDFDSIAEVLEAQFDDYDGLQTIERNIASLDSLSRYGDESVRNLRTLRTLYWKSRFMSRQSQSDSSVTLAKKALALTDSMRYPDDYMKILSRWYMEDGMVDGALKYRHFKEAMEYAQSNNDLETAASSAINLGNLLSEIGELDKGAYYYTLADSLNHRCGLEKLVVKNRLNLAKIQNLKGNPKEAERILRSLLGNPLLKSDTFAMNLVPFNLYLSTGDKAYLHTAYRQIKDSPRFRHLKGLYSALLARHNFSEGYFDSVIFYAEDATRSFPYVRDNSHRAIIWFNKSLAYTIQDKLDSALYCRIKFEECHDSVLNAQKRIEVVQLNAKYELARQESEFEASIQRRNWIWATIGLILLSGAALAVMWAKRRNLQHKLRAMRNELELEKTKRKMAATALTIEEKDKIFDSLRNELSDMRQEGVIEEKGARRLESTITLHLSENDNNEIFQEMFDVVHPDFWDRLRRICPDLTENFIKLACYIVMELDNKRIASLMMIKTESVRQSRWRLSQRLRVPENETLENFLRKLNNEVK